MIDALRRMFDYQDWAMERMWPALDQLTAAELDTPGCSGNGTIRETLTHLIRAHHGWFTRFDGTMSAEEAESEWWQGAGFQTMADAHSAWREASDRGVAYVAKLSDEDVAKIWTPALPGRKPPVVSLGDLLLHVANHGTHTRAQIVSAIRRLGKNPGISHTGGDVFDYSEFAITQRPA